MRTIPSSIEAFFFTPISANGFGLMRMAWAATVFIFMLLKMPDITMIYSSAGLMNDDVAYQLLRSQYHVSLFNLTSDPAIVITCYLLLLGSSACMFLGLWPRWSTVISVLLLLSFHERNYVPLGGGDTVLRVTGLILMIAPELRAYSLTRAKEQWLQWKKDNSILPHLSMSIWPYRLLLWQIIIIYIASGYDKVIGKQWLAGTAPALVFHHPHFLRWPLWTGDYLSLLAPIISYGVLVFEFSWLLLLIPNGWLQKATKNQMSGHTIKRALLLSGLIFHISIWIVLNVGSFSFAILALYCGLLLQHDFDAMRAFFNKKWKGKIHILYDGTCQLCRRSAFVMIALDCLERFDLVNYHHEEKRKQVAPKLLFEDLDKAMHIQLPDGRVRQGFHAFRQLCRHIPILWPICPFLYLPGMTYAGEMVYAYIAHKRRKCTDEKCDL